MNQEHPYKRMKIAINLSFIVIVASLLSGCSSGGPAAGMSDSEIKSEYDKMTPQDKIKFIASSPASGPEKEAKFKKIEEETGVKASDVLGANSSMSPGAGQAKTGP